MSAVVALIALAGLVVGLVSVVSPLKLLHIYNRWTGALIVVGSLLVLQTNASHPPDAAPVDPPKQIVRIKPAVSDGCDLAGAIPNCRAEIARLAAEEAAHPTPPRPAATAQPDRPDPYISKIWTEMQAEENARKADEARAGVAALERQRRHDELDFEMARTQADLEKTIAEGREQMRASQLDVDRAEYGVRVEQRNLDRLLRAR
jgi:hypothetical protein